MEVQLGVRPEPVTGDVAALDAAERARRARLRVALVAMPFVSARRPSIQLGLLAAIARSHGFPVETFHLNLDFAARIGADPYERLCQHRGRMLGDWLFSVAAFGDDAPDPDGELLRDLGGSSPEEYARDGVTPERLLEMRRVDVPAFVDGVLHGEDWSQFDVVGFTSTFQQSVASFALAAELKRRWPSITTVFGGANFDGEMGRELTRAVDAVDLAISGEADLAFPGLLVALSRGSDVLSVPGVLARRAGRLVEGPPTVVVERLDELPVPDYHEYFDRLQAVGLGSGATVRQLPIPHESARGCWWGAKRHCTFCGLNASTMAFRAKSPKRVVEELAELAARHRSFSFTAVDNILEPSYLSELFPVLREAESSYDLFYEVKANLSREELRTMRGAGVRHIQPGIESLSSHVLGLMRKGTRASTNVNLLRWARHYGIQVTWNLLWGFPGETEQDYAEQADMMRSLTHLQPPGGGGRIWMERFSPIFEDRDRFPARRVEPDLSYRYVYPAHVDLQKVAYFFDYELDGSLPDTAYFEVSETMEAWSRAWTGQVPPSLWMWRTQGVIEIDDRRDPCSPSTIHLEGPLAELYLACFDQPRTVSMASAASGVAGTAPQVEAVLDEFVARRLMIRDGNLFLALALPVAGPLGDLV
jgi:ribosomal peptide maturation radical SAM protein 1